MDNLDCCEALMDFVNPDPDRGAGWVRGRALDVRALADDGMAGFGNASVGEALYESTH